MLDAYIIEKIRKERGHRERERIPLHIEPPRHDPYDQRDDERRRDDEDEQKRGVAIIDFTI